MPIIKSAIKRDRQNAKRRSRNLVVKRAIKTDVRSLSDSVEAKDKNVIDNLKAAISEIDRAVKKGVLHKNTANRRKSSLTKLANTVVSPTKTKASPKPKSTKSTPSKKPASK